MTTISKFNGTEDTKPIDYDLEQWLKNTMDPEHPDVIKVLRYRATKNKVYKENLPCITISCKMDGYRSMDNITEKHHFICFDIDRYAKRRKKASNDCIDMSRVKDFFKKHPCTYFCGYSTSGDGVYVIMKVEYKDKLEEYFEYFQKSLALRGINIDASCKDYGRLRFFSFDPDAYFNPDAKCFGFPKIQKAVPTTGTGRLEDEEKIKKITERIEQQGIDITGDYDDWVKVGGAIAGAIGDSGRDYFHRISKQHPEYDVKKCDDKFNSCMKMSKTALGSLMYVAGLYGVRY